MNDKERYYEQDLSKIWSFSEYEKYKDATWNWWVLPFDDNLSEINRSLNKAVKKKVSKKSIIEIGSAMGRGYEFLKKSGIIDLSNYTGIEISDTGHKASKKLFPSANWIQYDFTKYEFTKKYDYGFERNAIHHMPEPIEQYIKILKNIKISFSTTFRGIMDEGTISDLDKCHQKNPEGGMAYWNFISVNEIVRIGLKEGFNHIRVIDNGKHWPISSDPESDTYMSAELQGKKDYSLFTVRFTKCPEFKDPLIYFCNPGKFRGINRWIINPIRKIRVNSQFKKLKKIYY